MHFSFTYCKIGMAEPTVQADRSAKILSPCEDTMVKLIAGVKGTGKTKTLIEMVHSALESTKGKVVCIEKSNKLRYDINYRARLIECDE